MVAIVLYGDVNENGKCHIDIQEHITKYMLDRVTKASLCLTTNRINTHTWGSPASWFAGQVQSLSSLGFIPDGDSGVFWGPIALHNTSQGYSITSTSGFVLDFGYKFSMNSLTIS